MPGGVHLSGSDNTQLRVRSTYERSFGVGDIVFDEGEDGDVLFVIQSGEIELSRSGEGGQRGVGRLGPGAFFGEMSVVLGEKRTTRATAVSETRLLELDSETLEAMCIERPEIAIRIIRKLTKRLIEAEQRLAALGVDDLLRPIVRSLVRGAVADAAKGVRIETTLRALAGDSGLSMLEAHRAIHQLLDSKVLRIADDVLIAKDIDSLSACLEAAD